MKAQANKLNAQIDNLEAAFEANRTEMQELIDQNKRATARYDFLLTANHRINDEIHALLEQLWKLQ